MTATQKSDSVQSALPISPDIFDHIWILTLRAGNKTGDSYGAAGIQTRFFLHSTSDAEKFSDPTLQLNSATRAAARYCERMGYNFMSVRPFLTEIGAE